MISCPACAKPKSNAPHPQNNEHTLSRPADTAYARRKKKKNSQRRGQRAHREKEKERERKKERKKIRTNCAKRRDRALTLSPSPRRRGEKPAHHCETPNIEKPKHTHETRTRVEDIGGLNTYLLRIYIVAQSVGRKETDEALLFRRFFLFSDFERGGCTEAAGT